MFDKTSERERGLEGRRRRWWWRRGRGRWRRWGGGSRRGSRGGSGGSRRRGADRIRIRLFLTDGRNLFLRLFHLFHLFSLFQCLEIFFSSMNISQALQYIIVFLQSLVIQQLNQQRRSNRLRRWRTNKAHTFTFFCSSHNRRALGSCWNLQWSF